MYKYSEKELALLKRLATSRDGKELLDLLEKLKVVWFDPEEVTAEQFQVRRDAILLLKEYLIKPIQSYKVVDQKKEEQKDGYI